MVIQFVVLSAVTLGVIMLMDMLECCLHTLRLHWVEFQDKFYFADGVDYKKFKFGQKEEEI